MTEAKIFNLNESNFSEITGAGVSLIDFWAAWCGPCQMLAPVIDGLAQEYSGVTFAKVNIDDQPDLARKWSVMTIPTVFILKDGEPLERFVGLNPGEVYKKALDSALT